MKGQLVIDFSQLTEDAKQKYIQFIIENNIQVSDENYVAHVKLKDKIPMPMQHQARQQSTLADIRNCRAFTPAKTCKQHIKQLDVPTIKFADLEEHYPLVMQQINNKEQLSRPLKVQIDEVINTLEEIYQRKFNEDSSQIQRNHHIAANTFQEYVHEFLKRKYKKPQLIINFMSSIDLYAQKRSEILTFQQFLRTHRPDNLTFFLFMREVVQKQLNVTLYHPLRKKHLDQHTIMLNSRQIQAILDMIYGDESLGLLTELRKNFTNGQISVADFFVHTLNKQEAVNAQKKYQQFKTMPDHPSIIKDEAVDETDLSDYDCLLKRIQSQKDDVTPPLFQTDKVQLSARFAFTKLTQNCGNELQRCINTNLESKISDFIEDMLNEIEDITEEQKQQCFREIEERIQDTVGCLLDAIYKFDKMIWFKKLQVTPDQQGLIYIENLQKQYKMLTRQQDTDIDQLCTSLMQVCMIVYIDT